MRKLLLALAVFAILMSILLTGCLGNKKNQKAASITLVNPAKGSTNVLLNSTFEWTEVPGATYRLLVAKDENFSQLMFEQTDIDTNTFDMPIGALAYNSTHFWRVFAILAGQEYQCLEDSNFSTESSIGILDDTFAGGQGFVVNDQAAGGSGDDFGEGITLSMTSATRAIDNIGRIVITGRGQGPSGTADMIVWRYNPDGTLDTTFNGTGIFSHHNAAGNDDCDRGVAVIVDSNNNIFVAGSSRSANDFDMTVWKICENGTLDTSFNGTGFFTENNVAGGNDCDNGNAILLDSKGRIIVAGNSRNSNNRSDMVIWRLNPNGTLDTTFNGTGHFIHNVGDPINTYSRADGIVFDKSGRMVVTGHCHDLSASTYCDMVVWRVNANGTLDTTFNGTGFFRYNSGNGSQPRDQGAAVIIDGQGRILVAGIRRNEANNADAAIWRLNSNGTLDTTFNGTGIFVVPFAASNSDKATSIVLDSLERILITGHFYNGSNGDMAVARILPDGTLDTTFGTLGIFYHHNAGGGDECDRGIGIMLDNLQRIVVCGVTAGPSNKDMVIWRIK